MSLLTLVAARFLFFHGPRPAVKTGENKGLPEMGGFLKSSPFTQLVLQCEG